MPAPQIPLYILKTCEGKGDNRGKKGKGQVKGHVYRTHGHGRWEGRGCVGLGE